MSRKNLIGKAVSTKMNKTVVVAINESHPHPKYGKIIHRTVKFKAHDPENKVTEGSIVRIQECRPLSRHKRWMVVEILETVQEV